MKTCSPFGDNYEYQLNESFEVEKIERFVNNNRQTVIIQGLGFVGAAMVAALTNAKDANGNPLYNVIGVDLPDTKNYWKIAMTNEYKPPIVSTDINIKKAFEKAKQHKNLLATHSNHAYSVGDIIVVDIHLDIKKKVLGNVKDYDFSYDIYEKAIKTVANQVKEEVLVIIETTVPPGTTEKIINPIFRKAYEERGLDFTNFSLAHSYERVMPGPNYFNSIVNFYRVFSGIDKKSKVKTRTFLESFINTKDYPLTELHATNASEIAKVLENSFRAMNIAFIKEWTQLAQSADVNLFEVIDAIRVRPTHKNIMLPGFGVGGYCLTKDALLADWAHKNHFNNSDNLDMSVNAISTNDLMPEYTFNLMKQVCTDLKNKNIGIMGISYLSDVSDTRYTPSELFFDLCLKEGAKIFLHDPLVSYWEEKDLSINCNLNNEKIKHVEIMVFTVRHKEYLKLTSKDFQKIAPNVKLIIDANNVIDDELAKTLKTSGIKIIGVGKGHWNNY